MQKILNRRVLRDLKENFFRYLALFMLIMMGMYVVISTVGAADTVLNGVESASKRNKLEDGQFSLIEEIPEENLNDLADRGIDIEKEFYLDYRLDDDSKIRVFRNRENINLIEVCEGVAPKSKSEIVLEKQYASKHNLKTGDSINIGGNNFDISGICTSPDYDAVLENLSDAAVDSESFGTAFVLADEYNKLKKENNFSKAEEFVYSYLLNGKMTDKELKDYLKDIKLDLSKVSTEYLIYSIPDSLMEMMTSSDSKDINIVKNFLKKDDNPRIAASSDDVRINKYVGVVAGVIIMILFTYVISVFVIHNIEAESSVIGALYALGVKKRDLTRHYLTLPVVITFLGGTIGTIIGYSPIGVDLMNETTASYFSVPMLKVSYSISLLLYGVIMPPVVAAIVNYLVINKKLSQPALKMIRNEKKQGELKSIKLPKWGFIHKFQLRQFIREFRTSFTVIIGLFISLLILFMGINCYGLCTNMISEYDKDTKFEYMYTYKFPGSSVPENAEACFIQDLKKEAFGYNLDVNLVGIDDDNKYYDFNVSKGKDKVAVSESAATKFNLSVGDKVVLNDSENEKDYAFTVDKIVPYSVGLQVFMDIDDMRELFNQKDDYFNVVLSDNKLNISTEMIYSTTTREDILKSSKVFQRMMVTMITSLTLVSGLIFVVVMYLMMKVMIERSSFNISLMKIFGFRKNEIKKLYLDGNFYLVALGALVSIPLSKFLMDKIYPYFVSNVASGVNLTLDKWIYAAIYLGILLCYLVINHMLVRKLNKMVPAEVLKNRE